MGRTTPEMPAAVADGYAALDHAHQHLIAAEIAEVIALASLIDSYEIDGTAVGEGIEALMYPGADGTPGVGEFLAMEVGPLLGLSPGAAIERIADVINVRHRLPSLWSAVLQGRVRWWQAVQVAKHTGHLDRDAILTLDRHLSHAMALQPWSRVRAHLPGWILAADPAAARAAERRLRNQRKVSVGQIVDGHIEIWGRLAPEDAIAFDHAITRIARELPSHTDPTAGAGLPDHTGAVTADLDCRRAAAVGALARQAFGQDALPTHQLIVHITGDDAALRDADEDRGTTRFLPDGSGTGIARVEGWGSLPTQRLRELLAHSRVIVRPVLDPAAITPVDQHDPPELMRLAAVIRTPADVFPYGRRRAGACDLDHTEPYISGGRGQTRMDNLGPLSRRAHRVKTHGGWRLSQPAPGVYRWRSPAGYEYLVTAEGTVRLTSPPAPRRPPAPPAHPEDPPGHDPAWDQLPDHAPPTIDAAA